MNEQYQVQHQFEKQQFIIELSEEQAVLQYSFDPAELHVHFYHTYVPVSARGKGVANQLVAAGINWAEEHHYRISNSCSYVQLFLSKK